MNQKEWKESLDCCDKHLWYNKTRKIQRSLQFNEDKTATVIHHLRDTEEQRKYNDDHYELWGFEIDEDGNEHFAYGKYVIFVTKEEHAEIHKRSEETKMKISEATKAAMLSKEVRYKIRAVHTGKKLSEEHKKKIMNSMPDVRGENNPMYGRHLSEEHKKKISESEKGKITSEYTKKKQSESKLGEKNPMYGKHLSDSHKHAISNKLSGRKKSEEARNNSKAAIREMSDKYFKYKEDGGTLNWNEFKHNLKEQKTHAKQENKQT